MPPRSIVQIHLRFPESVRVIGRWLQKATREMIYRTLAFFAHNSGFVGTWRKAQTELYRAGNLPTAGSRASSFFKIRNTGPPTFTAALFTHDKDGHYSRT